MFFFYCSVGYVYWSNAYRFSKTIRWMLHPGGGLVTHDMFSKSASQCFGARYEELLHTQVGSFRRSGSGADAPNKPQQHASLRRGDRCRFLEPPLPINQPYCKPPPCTSSRHILGNSPDKRAFIYLYCFSFFRKLVQHIRSILLAL